MNDCLLYLLHSNTYMHQRKPLFRRTFSSNLERFDENPSRYYMSLIVGDDTTTL